MQGYVGASLKIMDRPDLRVADMQGSRKAQRQPEVSLASFAWSCVGLATGSKCRVYSGLFIVDGRGMWRWPDASSAYDDISVTGNGWIYGYTTRTSPAKPTVAFQASEPNPAQTSQYQFPICQVEYDGTTTACWVTRQWAMGGSVIFGAV
jgi:hypothetical protein